MKGALKGGKGLKVVKREEGRKGMREELRVEKGREGLDRKKLFKEKSCLCPNNQGGKCHFG